MRKQLRYRTGLKKIKPLSALERGPLVPGELDGYLFGIASCALSRNSSGVLYSMLSIAFEESQSG